MTNTMVRKETVGELLPVEVKKSGHKGKKDVCPKHIYFTEKKTYSEGRPAAGSSQRANVLY